MDIRKYIYSHCVSPTRLSIFNAATGMYEPRFVPCGKCLHCRNQKVNEWTTRLYAHALYSKNVYYITLDYAPFNESVDTAMQLACDTAAAWHDLNINHAYGLHPILLRKEHLQKFFKRLRKNNPKKSFQYFACGEYGHRFSRPHFHVIVFSNDTFTDSDFQSAWTVNGYRIGNVDFNDLRSNGSFIDNKKNNNLNAKYVFSYVCKYLQKGGFDFDKIATFEYHKAYFKSLQKVCTNPDELFPEYAEITDEKVLDDSWQKYTKAFAPFVCCSKRPAIGLQYLQENVQRFQAQDFRLFGLSKECVAFPHYWIRKTKESLCCYQGIGEISGKPSSNCSIGSIVSFLSQVRDTNRSIETWTADAPYLWCPHEDGERISYTNGKKDYYSECCAPKLIKYSFYDADNKIYYYFTGYDFVLKQKVRKIGFVTLGNVAIDYAITMLQNGWTDYYERYLVPMNDKRLIADAEINGAIKRAFPELKDSDNTDLLKPPYDYMEEFRKLVYSRYRSELSHWNMRGQIINNTKIEF